MEPQPYTKNQGNQEMRRAGESAFPGQGHWLLQCQMISLEIDMQLILYEPNRLYLWIDGEVIYVYNNN